MNILFITTSFPTKGQPATGYPNYLLRVSLALINLGHTPIILSAGINNGRRFDNGIEIRTVKYDYVDLDNKVLNYVVNSLRKSYTLNKEIKNIQSKRKIDIIQFTSLEGTALFYHGKTPAVLRLSSYAKTYFSSYSTYTKTHVKVMSFMECLSSQKCNAIFAPCQITAQAFGKDTKRKVYTIETPFIEDVQVYDETYLKRNLKDKKYVLFFGTLYAEKGIKVISDCLERFLKKNRDYYFAFVGRDGKIGEKSAGALLKSSAGKYKNRIVILPEMTHTYLYPIVKNADFVVLPSLMDNLPNACIEAMYFGKIVIGTAGASFEQLIDDKINGFLCNIGDSEDLLIKMQEVVELDSCRRKEIGINAQQRVDLLRPEKVVKQLVKFYQAVIKKRKAF